MVNFTRPCHPPILGNLAKPSTVYRTLAHTPRDFLQADQPTHAPEAIQAALTSDEQDRRFWEARRADAEHLRELVRKGLA